MRRLDSLPLEIVVGRDETAETTYVHKDLATKFSDVVALSVKGGFKEAEEGIVRFPEEDPELFRIFAGFIYTGFVHSKKCDGYPEIDRLAALWVLGEKLQAGEFKDAVVDAMIERLGSTTEGSDRIFTMIYSNSVGASGMRRLMVDLAAWCSPAGTFRDAARKEESKEFFYDLAVKYQGLYGVARGSSPFRLEVTCAYHDHGSKKACYKTLF